MKNNWESYLGESIPHTYECPNAEDRSEPRRVGSESRPADQKYWRQTTLSIVALLNSCLGPLNYKGVGMRDVTSTRLERCPLRAVGTKPTTIAGEVFDSDM